MDALPVSVVTHMAIPTTTQIVLFWFCRIFGLIWLILSFSLFFRILTIDYTAKKEVSVFLRIPFPIFVIWSFVGLSIMTLFILLYGHFGIRGTALYSFLFICFLSWSFRVWRSRQFSPRFSLICGTRKDWLISLFSTSLISVLSFHFFAYSAFRLSVDVLSIS